MVKTWCKSYGSFVRTKNSSRTSASRICSWTTASNKSRTIGWMVSSISLAWKKWNRKWMKWWKKILSRSILNSTKKSISQLSKTRWHLSCHKRSRISILRSSSSNSPLQPQAWNRSSSAQKLWKIQTSWIQDSSSAAKISSISLHVQANHQILLKLNVTKKQSSISILTLCLKVTKKIVLQVLKKNEKRKEKIEKKLLKL